MFLAIYLTGGVFAVAYYWAELMLPLKVIGFKRAILPSMLIFLSSWLFWLFVVVYVIYGTIEYVIEHWKGDR